MRRTTYRPHTSPLDELRRLKAREAKARLHARRLETRAEAERAEKTRRVRRRRERINQTKYDRDQLRRKLKHDLPPAERETIQRRDDDLRAELETLNLQLRHGILDED